MTRGINPLDLPITLGAITGFLVKVTNTNTIKRSVSDLEKSLGNALQDAQLARSESRQYKQTITVLRDKLEDLRREKNAEVQRGKVQNESNISQYKLSIEALRDELEDMRLSKESNLQSQRTESLVEMKELRETAISLRSALEDNAFTHQTKLQEMAREINDEKSHLQNTITKLREELENLTSRGA